MMATPSADRVAERAPGFVPRVGLILGSGLGGVADRITDPIAIPYADLPGFPQPRVEGHAGRLVLGRLGGEAVACLQGRVHLFEGADAADIRLLVRTLKRLGCEILIATNAAGSLRADMATGSLMMLADHINLLPMNPLVGPNDDAFGPRFPALDEAYDPVLRDRFRAAAGATGVALAEGVYLAYLGPSFSTAAESRAFIRLGADAVGMSTVPEVIVARHCGLRVAAISAIVSPSAGVETAAGSEAASHEQTLVMAARAGEDLSRLLVAFLERLSNGDQR
jgi:xanthosine phosphorylase